MEDLRLGYGRAPDVIAGASLELPEGSTIAIVGPSGEGKTTLLKAAAGLLAPRSGRLEVAGATWPKSPPPGTVGYVPQRLGLVRHASVLDNVLHGGLHETGFLRSLLHAAPSTIRQRAEEALQAVGLPEKAEAPVHELSGGQQRRVAVARAMVQRPRLLLADEFLAELDPATAESVLGAVKALQAQTGMALLVVEHHLEQALRLADQVFRVKGGRLLALEET